MRRHFGKAAMLTVGVLGATAAVDCSDPSTKAFLTDPDDSTGSVGFKVQVAPGVFVSTVSYFITGPGGFTRNGTLDVSNSDVIAAVVGGLRAGNGYQITFLATANGGDAGAINCAGSAIFDILPRFTTVVIVHLTCQRPKVAGSVLVNGTLNVCPVIDSASSTAPVNGAIQLSSTASDLDGLPAPLAFHWDILAGPAVFLGNFNIANPQLTCTSSGTVSLRLTVSDGLCSDTFAMLVTCVAGAIPDAGAGGAGGSVGADAGSTGGDPVSVLGVLLGTRGASCFSCAQAYCATEAQGCDQLVGNAQAGPAVGVSRRTLCLDTVRCVGATSCGSTLLSTCYCGTSSGAACLTPGVANGACKSETERGLETVHRNRDRLLGTTAGSRRGLRLVSVPR
jgi:hypothetical protein